MTFGNKTHSRIGFFFTDVDYSSIPKSVKFIYNHYYIDIPLKVTYKMGKGKIRIIGGLGITTNILIKSTQQSIFEYQNGDKEKSTVPANEAYKQLNLSPNISFGIERKFKSNHVVRVEYNVSHGILGIIDAPITANLWSSGINFSYYFGLKKNLN